MSPKGNPGMRRQDRTVTITNFQTVAEKLFLEYGFHKTSIEAVAKTAGASVGSIYNYFESKEDLFLSLLPARLDALAASLRGARDAVAVRRQLAAWRTAHAPYTEEAFAVLAWTTPPALSPDTVARISTGLATVMGAVDRHGGTIWPTFLGDMVTARAGAALVAQQPTTVASK